ncbi:Putative negative regulator of RcsB-dependent stress response [Pseudoxanthomonas sp. GM95]|uniref:YfgM family protein n=1 Tax=Pseudoxanthomonas sp. GM95 TaxID=1881043 RepID=UPI0008B4DEB2|nr:tetratricopeptide repeat protein [Pseudoxanthomonas sp. GM95]SEL92714.1 Putative negative regulator of RcsB-dependent stress response [Pseudoxanthomonas sp. GM95]
MAIDDLLDEHEQSERVRNWLKNNGAGLIGGIALGLALIFGWKWWGQHQDQQAQAGYGAYAAAVKSISGTDLKDAQSKVTALQKDGDSVYAQLAALQLAQAQVKANQNDAALATLKSLPAGSAMKPYADLHAARLLNATGKPDEAIKLLASYDSSSALEARGDALALTGKRDEARDTYLKALTSLDVASPQRRLVEVKLTNAGGTVPGLAESN